MAYVGFPIGGGTPAIYHQLTAATANVITAASWAATSGGQVTFSTTSSHGIPVGGTFVISGMTPAGYNGTFVAISGTTGSTLVAVLTTNPGTATVMGTMNAQIATASPLPVPFGARSAVITVNTAAVRWRHDGVAPTASLGMQIAAGDTFQYVGNLSALQIIAVTGTPVLDIAYYT